MKLNLYRNILIAASIVAVVSACSEDKAAKLEELRKEKSALEKEIAALEKEVAGGGTPQEKSKEVSAVELKSRSFDHYVQTQGMVESEENIQVSAKTMGIITQVKVREGEVVSKGQVLAQIDNSLIVTGIEELKSSLELANTVFERQKNLWNQKIGTEVQYLQAKNNKESLEKRLESLQEQNEMTRIKSPINGVVDEVQVKVGQNIAPGMPAVRVVNNSDLKLVANISEAYVSMIKKGNKVIVSFPDIKKEFVTTIRFAGRNINQFSRTFAVEMALPSVPDLRPNMAAIIKIIYETHDNTIVVPVNVVQSINGEKVVYIAESNGGKTIARRKVVTVQGVFGTEAEVKGLQSGDRIVTFGFQGLNDGELIKI